MERCEICDKPFDGGAVLQHRETDEIHLWCKACTADYLRRNPHEKETFEKCSECGKPLKEDHHGRKGH